MVAAAINADGRVDGWDAAGFIADYNAEDSRADVNFDWQVDFDDYLDFVAAYDGGAGEAGGRGVLSRASVGNRIGYAGYQWDPSIKGTTGGKWHVRHRVLESGLGRWLTRDPLGYVDGASLYGYGRGGPVRHTDPLGMMSLPCPSSFDCGAGGPPSTNPSPPKSRTPAPAPAPAPPFPHPPTTRCSNDPAVKQLLALWPAHCARPTILEQPTYDGTAPCFDIPGINGVYCCLTNTVVLCPNGTCMTLYHELVHALDHCQGAFTCTQSHPNDVCGLPRTCGDRACSEIRAYALSGECCVPAFFGGFRIDPACVKSRAENSVGPGCKNWVSINWQRCFDPLKNVLCPRNPRKKLPPESPLIPPPLPEAPPARGPNPAPSPPSTAPI